MVDNDRSGDRSRVTAASRKVAVALMGGAALVMASCTSGGSTSPTTTSGSSTTVAGSTSTAGTAVSTTSTSSPGIQNLPVSNTVKNQLSTAYVAFRGFKATDVIGTAPNSVYYAFDPSSGTYWAMAEFVPSQEAGNQVQVSMQDAGGFAWFSQKSGDNWKARNGSFPPWCHADQFFPSGVLAVWAISAAQLTC
jgi:hypothetical protein